MSHRWSEYKVRLVIRKCIKLASKYENFMFLAVDCESEWPGGVSFNQYYKPRKYWFYIFWLDKGVSESRRLTVKLSAGVQPLGRMACILCGGNIRGLNHASGSALSLLFHFLGNYLPLKYRINESINRGIRKVSIFSLNRFQIVSQIHMGTGIRCT